MRSWGWTLALLAVGCVERAETFEESLPAAGVFGMDVHLDRGDFDYHGAQVDVLHILGTSWGRGRGPRWAEYRMEQNAWSWEADGGVFVGTGRSPNRAGIDLDVQGPELMDLAVQTENGRVHLQDVEGVHLVTASRISSTRLIGNADLYATSGMDVEIWPYHDGQVHLEVERGDVHLHLPYGGPYDIQVWGDPDRDMAVADLGFHHEQFSPGYYAGIAGDGSIQVRVFLSRGRFRLHESR